MTRLTDFLRGQPDVADAAVMTLAGRDGSPVPVAYLVPESDRGSRSDRRAEAQEQIDAWRGVYDALYTQRDAAESRTGHDDLSASTRSDPGGPDFAGWISSFTRDAIPEPEMCRWRDAAVDLIRAQAPRRVLEIGAGSGLLLAPLAPSVDSYWATDLSGASVDRLRALAEHNGWHHVQVRCQPADDVSGLPAGEFDTIVLNSVIQYFPSTEYLDRVLVQALQLAAPGGRLVLGDVRHAGLLRVLHTAAYLAQNPDRPVADPSAVDRAMILDKELLVSPEFFVRWAARQPHSAGVDIRLKRVASGNELTRYRYEVIIHKAPARTGSLMRVPTVHWGQDVSALSELEGRIPREAGHALRVAGIPNRRLFDDVTDTWSMLGIGSGSPSGEPIEPETVCRWATEQGSRSRLTWSTHGLDRFDAVLACDNDPGVALVDSYQPGHQGTPLGVLASDPLGARRNRRLITSVGKALAERFPADGTPIAIAALERLPATESGDLDPGALPTLDYLVGSGLGRVLGSA